MDPLRQKAFFIGDWKVSPTEGLLLRGDDVVHIEPKAMELLVYLAAHQGEVVAREDIEKDVWGVRWSAMNRLPLPSSSCEKPCRITPGSLITSLRSLNVDMN